MSSSCTTLQDWITQIKSLSETVHKYGADAQSTEEEQSNYCTAVHTLLVQAIGHMTGFCPTRDRHLSPKELVPALCFLRKDVIEQCLEARLTFSLFQRGQGIWFSMVDTDLDVQLETKLVEVGTDVSAHFEQAVLATGTLH